MALKLEDARNVLLESVRVLPGENIPLLTCGRRVLAETVTADMDFPPFDRSPLDGYALIAQEVQGASPEEPVVLREIGEIPAGGSSDIEVRRGTACRIMTGAALPPGATGVVKLEDTWQENGVVGILAGKGAADNICFRGEEIVKGEELIPAGTVINSGVMGMLAVFGKSSPYVFKQPRVALIATGSEILPVESMLSPGKIRNSNSYMLNAQVGDACAQTAFLGTAQDKLEDIQSVLNKAQGENCDLVITTGGASVGDYDLISDVFRSMGAKVLFEHVRIKPGMPVIAAIKDNTLFIGLSGNPAAAAISFEQLVRPVLLKMGGRKVWWRPKIQAVLTDSFEKASSYKRFVWARCWQEAGEIRVRALKLQRNGMLKSAMIANSLIIIPENMQRLTAGEIIDIELLADL